MHDSSWSLRRWLGALTTAATAGIAGCNSSGAGTEGGTAEAPTEPTDESRAVAGGAATQTETWQASRARTARRIAEAVTSSLVSFVSPVDGADTDQLVVVWQANVDVLGGDLPAPVDGLTALVDGAGRVVSESTEEGVLDRNDGRLEEYAGGTDREYTEFRHTHDTTDITAALDVDAVSASTVAAVAGDSRRTLRI